MASVTSSDTKRLKLLTKAVKQHCLSCSGGVQQEVDACYVTTCELYPYRKGKIEEPVTKKRTRSSVGRATGS